MRGARLGANASGAWWDDGVEEGDDVDAAIEHAGGKFLREARVADHDGDDRVKAFLYRQSGGAKAVAKVTRVRFEPVAEFGRTGDKVESGDRRGGDDGSEAVGKEVRAGALAKEFDDFATAADVTATRAAEGFAESAGKKIDAADDVAALGGAAAGASENADSMAVVDHDHGVVPFGEIADFAKAGDGAVHRKHAVGGDEFEASAIGVGARELGVEIGEVVVAVAVAPGLGEADAVDDGSVIEFVADHGVLGAEQGFEKAGIGVEAGGVEQRVLGAEKLAEAGLQFAVDLLRAADEANGGKPVTPTVEGGVGGGDEGGVVGETEVVVGAEIEQAGVIGGVDTGLLRGSEKALGFAKPGGFEVGRSLPQMGEKGRRHGLNVKPGGGEATDVAMYTKTV